MTPLVLGIDFGTSNSAAAVCDASGALHVIALESPKAEMPTALFFNAETHTVSFGAQAMQEYLCGTEGRLLRSLKSVLGSALMDEQTIINHQSILFFDIVVLFFKELKRRCETQIGQPLTHAMLGRPVHFVDDDPQRDALAQATLARAAYAAGFSHIDFQLEPIAAAFDYEHRVHTETTALIVDIGGGTSDFTVMRLNPLRSTCLNRQEDLLATTGIHIGGTDFDRLLDLSTVMPSLGYQHVGKTGRPVPNGIFFDLSTWHLIQQAYSRKVMHFAKELWTDYADMRLHARLMHVLELQLGHRILAEVEAAKISCSLNNTAAAVDLRFLDIAEPQHITPAQMNTTLTSPLQQIVQCALSCVAQSGLASVDVIYLTGGSSALRPLGDALQQALPNTPVVHGNRFGGVAAGLAYYGAVHPPTLTQGMKQ